MEGSMQRYARYWGEDDDERGHDRGYERGPREGRGYGERGGWLGGREQHVPRGRYYRDWRDTEPYYGGRREEGWGERGGYGRGYHRDEERGWMGPRGEHRGMPRGWGERGERPQYGEGRGPIYGYGPERDREREGARWERGEREQEPGLMERIGEGIRNFFAGDDERGPHPGKGPKGYRRSDDRIREDVCDRIATWGWVDASDVEVRVQEGEVTLSGQVGARRDKRMLEEMLEGIPGVLDIHNQVRVRREMGQRPLAEASRPGSRTA
jgi:hypothetical protein